MNGDKLMTIAVAIAVFKEEFKPLAFKPRRKRGVQIFPNEPQGLNTGEGRLPFPNVATTIIPIVAEDVGIEFRLPKNPMKWGVSPALPARTRYVLIEIDDISPNKLASIEEVEIQNAACGD